MKRFLPGTIIVFVTGFWLVLLSWCIHDYRANGDVHSGVYAVVITMAIVIGIIAAIRKVRAMQPPPSSGDTDR
jgi:hypothetical protein